MGESDPFISVIIPVHNGGAAFRVCLEALQASDYPAWEGIIVDDGSSDGSSTFAAAAGLHVVGNPTPGGGPAAARNFGARLAAGEILLFLDADVGVQPHSLSHVAQIFSGLTPPAACFGSYDDAPAAPNFLSQYKNLQHHYVHQHSREEAFTFWSGCGAIRRDVFLEMGGFSERYRRPSIEDIELGYRLRAAGYSTRLVKFLQVKHLKRWTARSLLVTDIRDRAIPWSRLMLERGQLPDDLNVQRAQRLSGALVLSGLTLGLLGLPYRPLRWLALAAISGATAINCPFYCFLARKRGPAFALQSWPWHLFYLLYSTVAFVYSVTRWYRPRRRQAAVVR
jgi:GT2 family glycosyltransferase